MGTSNKYAPEILTTVCMVVFFLSTAAADSLPTAEDINSLTETVRLTTDAFMQESFQLRMGYEYSGKFLPQADKENLHKLAKSASNHLQIIAKNQQQIKQQIEDYQGDDWDQRYGSTGLWRKLSSDVYITSLSKYEIDFYLALTAEQPQRNKILHNILAEIDSLELMRLPATSQLLKARALALLAQTEPAYKSLAGKEHNMLMIRPDMRHSTALRTTIERIKLLGPTKADNLDKLTEAIAKSSCSDDMELVLSLASLQRKYNRPEGLEKIVSLWPQTEDFLASVVLADLAERISRRQLTEENLEQMGVFEAELTAQAIWKNEAKDYKMLLERLASVEKFQKPLILYVAALAFAESSPTKAVNLLVKASSLQQVQKSNKLNIEAYKIAGQAAQLAYNLFVAAPTSNKQRCPLAIEAFENYCTIGGEKIDEELEYLYSIVLNDCGRIEESKELLEKIANRPAGNRRNRARLDLIVQAMRQTQDSSQEQQRGLLEQLRDLILSCHGQDENNNKLRMEAITIYCQSLLELKNEDSAQNVLTILAEAETTRGINLNLFRAQALQQLGRLDESAHYMLLAIQDDSGPLAGVVRELLAEAIEKIDEFKTEPVSPYSVEMIENCKKLAKFSYLSLNDRKSGLFLVEISVLAADKDKGKLSEVEKLLNILSRDAGDDDVGFLRCRARLLSEQDRFEEAAGLWAKVCQIRKSEPPSASQRSWKWWRAKFYELYCWSKCPQTKKEEVLHTIEVLESSFQDVPPLWAEKLNFLKQQCRSKDNSL